MCQEISFYNLDEKEHFAVQVRSVGVHDEELAARRVGVHGAGHADDAAGVLDGVVDAVAGELTLDVPARAAGAVAQRAVIFPHHECEIAQSVASQGDDMVHYWMHNNMITINGQKMGKSYGNFINLDEFFHGTHKLLTQAYSPMTIRFFILQAHYRSTVDFSNEALQAAEKGLERLTEAVKGLERITPATQTTGIEGVKDLREKCYTAMNDDLNSGISVCPGRLFYVHS